MPLNFLTWLRAASSALLLGALLSLSAPAAADDYSAQWGPAVGAGMPLLAAADQTGASRSLENLAGEQGLLLFLNRSAEW